MTSPLRRNDLQRQISHRGDPAVRGHGHERAGSGAAERRGSWDRDSTEGSWEDNRPGQGRQGRDVSSARGDEASMSGERRRTRDEEKIDQIVYHFFTKTTQTVLHARLPHLEPSQRSRAKRTTAPTGDSSNPGPAIKSDRWFNLELPDVDLFRDELRTWQGVSSFREARSDGSFGNPVGVPIMVLEIILDASSMRSTQVLVLRHSDGRRTRVYSPKETPRHRNIVLERWSLFLEPLPTSGEQASPIPTVYKKAIIFFRTLYTFLMAMEGQAFYKRMGKRTLSDEGLRVGCRLSMRGQESADDRGPEGNDLELDTPIDGEEAPATATKTRRFTPVQTPIGSLSLHCTYRTNIDFQVEDAEALLSSRFIDEDFFKPTVARYTERTEDVVRTGSLPIRTAHFTGSAARVPFGSVARASELGASGLAAGARTHETRTEPREDQAQKSHPRAISIGGLSPPFASSPRQRQDTFSASRSGSRQTWTGSPASRISPMERVPASVPSPGPSTSVMQMQMAGSYRHSSSPSTGGLRTSSSSLTRSNQPPLQDGSPPSARAQETSAPQESTAPALKRYPSARYSSSYGASSSPGSSTGGEGPPWGNASSIRGLSRFSVSSRGETSSVGSSGQGQSQQMRTSPDPEESDEINDLLGMIDSRPQLLGGLGKSTIVSKNQAGEALRRLAQSVHRTPVGPTPVESVSPSSLRNPLPGSFRRSPLVGPGLGGTDSARERVGPGEAISTGSARFPFPEFADSSSTPIEQVYDAGKSPPSGDDRSSPVTASGDPGRSVDHIDDEVAGRLDLSVEAGGHAIPRPEHATRRSGQLYEPVRGNSSGMQFARGRGRPGRMLEEPEGNERSTPPKAESPGVWGRES